ncbi:threonine/homoserine/homoserine lactone efflux protein [Pseudomonas duriflava]|uniref:Threonine/homoserine/homoserine lactone efflux protein n=1 Tax=Pseudomonas duriflava TaxID=459528 RepID=A0A562Q7Q4_9PSED|nr:LysE family translocator [Pseudomonas duriflava]TWI52795.1 threonine/homoserine/homoserine lactone efflux protein [Pseudomonas duriflava]
MTPELLAAFIMFAFVSSVTPGPNNMMLLASGVNYGFRRTLPHMLGISLGHMLMVILMGLGLGQLFTLYPVLHTGLKLLAALYLSYLAWKIATAVPPTPTEPACSKPFGFFQAAAFQWVNPKAWVMAIGAITTYLPTQDFYSNLILIALLFALINIPSVSAWTLFGMALRSLLGTPTRLRIFNWTMAALLMCSLYPLVLSTH